MDVKSETCTFNLRHLQLKIFKWQVLWKTEILQSEGQSEWTQGWWEGRASKKYRGLVVLGVPRAAESDLLLCCACTFLFPTCVLPSETTEFRFRIPDPVVRRVWRAPHPPASPLGRRSAYQRRRSDEWVGGQASGLALSCLEHSGPQSSWPIPLFHLQLS